MLKMIEVKFHQLFYQKRENYTFQIRIYLEIQTTSCFSMEL